MNEYKPCTKSRQISAFPHPKLPQSYGRIPKGKNGWETTAKNGKESCCKELVKQRKHYLSLARKSFKTRRILSETGGRNLNILQKRDVLGQNGRVESMQFILRTILVITFHKLYHRHSERLSLQSSETKSHQHRNSKAFASLNPCPRLVDVLIWITIRRIPQIPGNTCVPSHVRLCTQKSFWEWSPPSWIRTNPLLMPHIPQDKSDKTRESLTYWGLKELPIWW